MGESEDRIGSLDEDLLESLGVDGEHLSRCLGYDGNGRGSSEQERRVTEDITGAKPFELTPRPFGRIDYDDRCSSLK